MPPVPPRQLAELVLAVGTGVQLEQAASPDALGGELVADVLAQVLIRPGIVATAGRS